MFQFLGFLVFLAVLGLTVDHFWNKGAIRKTIIQKFFK